MTSSPREQVLITGICGSLGQLIAEKIGVNHHVLGVDRRPFPNKHRRIEHHQLDLRHKSAYQILKKRKPTCIIHVGVIRNPSKHRNGGEAYHFNLEVTSQLLKLAEELSVRKFVFLSSANLYGPSVNTAGFLAEDAPLHGANRSPEIRDLVALDMMIQSFFWKQPNIETVILRPVHIVGPHLQNAPSRYLRQEKIPTLLGFDPMLQVVHESDVVKAIELSLAPSKKGIFNITGRGQAPLSRIIQARSGLNFPVPEFFFRTLLQTAFKFSLSQYPPGELDHLKYPCLVEGTHAKTILGYEASFGLRDTVANLVNPTNVPKLLPAHSDHN